MAVSWQDQSTEILRILINDFSETKKYDDNTLEQLLFVAAQYVAQEVKGFSYTFNFMGLEILPDPLSNQIFMNLMILKAACLTNTWEFNKKAIMDGISARLGLANLSVTSNGPVIMGLLNMGFCRTYETLVNQFNFGRGDFIKAILSPFSSSQLSFDDGHGYRNC